MKRIVFLVGVLSIFLVTLAMDFKPPSSVERLRAIGETSGLEEILRKALEPGNDFKPIPIPKSGDCELNH